MARMPAMRTESRSERFSGIVPSPLSCDEQDGLQILADVSESNREDLPRLFTSEWLAGARRQWKAGLLLWRICEEDAWRDVANPRTGQPYRNPADWVLAQNLPGLRHRSTVSRVIWAVGELAGSTPDQQQRCLGVSMWDLVEVKDVVTEHGIDAALEIAEAPLTSAEKRRKVRELAGESQHRDVDYRTFSVAYPVSLQATLEAALNRARFECGAKDPPDSALFEWLLTLALQEPLAPEMEPDREAIETGLFRCRNCGSWDARELERHHVRPRSHGGHDGPIALLCRSCHAEIQPRWREWAKEQGYDESVHGG